MSEEKQQQQQEERKKADVLRSKRAHFILSLLYGVVVIIFIMLPIAFTGYTITYQSGLLYLVLFCAGVLICTKPDRDGLVQREYRVILCTSIFISVACIFLCAIQPLNILINECPKYDSSSFSVKDTDGNDDAYRALKSELQEKNVFVDKMDVLSSGQTSVEEDEWYYNIAIRRVCRNEQGFIIIYLVFMLLLAILQFVTFLWFTFQMKDRKRVKKI